MRVIAGTFKGKKLASTDGDIYRPTLDRVKESIFNVLGDDIIDKNILDLFCGSGSLGIEAISRGAIRATFVDNNKKILNAAKKNIEMVNAWHKAKPYLKDAFKFLEENKNVGFDIIFADPPYDKQLGSRLCHDIMRNNSLKPGGIFILERYKKESPDHEMLRLVKQLKFGQTEIDFYTGEN